MQNIMQLWFRVRVGFVNVSKYIGTRWMQKRGEPHSLDVSMIAFRITVDVDVDLDVFAQMSNKASFCDQR